MEQVNYFPLLIKYTESCIETVVNDPSEIKNGISFKVLKTNYQIPADSTDEAFVFDMRGN